jgi:tripartite-type tricarboxylate transporter receptor subunit TctC
MRLTLAAVVAAVVATASPAAAQPWPAKPVKVVVPFGPGTTTDAVARVLTNELAQALGQPFVIVNKGGADGAIGATELVRSAPDGYTLMVGSNSSIVVVPLMRKQPPYATLTDFTPVSMLGESSFFIAVNATVPAKSLAELIAHAKANPGKLSYGTGNTTGIVSSLLLSKAAGIQMLHVPYKSEPEAIPDLLSGQLQVMMSTFLNVGQHAHAGKVRLLATTLPVRSALAPDIPTLQEAGQARLPVGPWVALVGPANMPAEVTAKLNAAVVAAFAMSEVHAQLVKQGFEPKTSTAVEFGAFLKDQADVWGLALKEGGLEPQ